MQFTTRKTTILLATAALVPLSMATSSSKRGLVFVATEHPSDDQTWVEPGSDLTWYYNYVATPTDAYSNRSQAEFEYVPMLFSPPSSDTDTTFSDDVRAMISGGRNISHILTYNEPDGSTSTGGSNVPSDTAAATWLREIEPLRALGIKAGAPAVTGSQTGFNWLANFFAACTSQGTNCTVDFIPIHWYGNFEGLASHIGQVVQTYPNTTIWVTEYALNDADLTDSQSFYNSSSSYFDRLDYVERYSYFGSFRSSVSNVGPNAAMLDQQGRLTDIGSWYLGGSATNNIPGSGAPTLTTPMGSWGFVSLLAIVLLGANIVF